MRFKTRLERSRSHVANAILQSLMRVTDARDLSGLLEMGLVVRRGAEWETY
jgi:hypothetical protein